MFATVLSPVEDLLVVREQNAKLPDLVKQGRLSPANVRLVAQLVGESHRDFASRVLARAVGSSAHAPSFRGAIVSLQSDSRPEVKDSRIRLVAGVAAVLACRSDAELILLAPANVGALERIALFELVEATLHAVPRLNVRLAFESPDHARFRSERTAVGTNRIMDA